jgi:predicted MFS family arabinose efflux permease
MAGLAALPFTTSLIAPMFVNPAIWGVFAFGIAPMVLSGVVGIAEVEAPDAVGTASGFNIAAFNLGISGASFIGSMLVAGPGILVTPWASVSAAVIALLIVGWLARKRQRALLRV